MFICSVKATTLRFFSVLLLSAVALAGVTVFATSTDTGAVGAMSEKVSYEGIKTESDRRAFLASFGYEVKSDAESTVDFTLPRSLDAVLLDYNELQKKAGLDLSKYAGKKVTRYTYLLPKQEGYEGNVYANIIVYRSRVVAADLTGVGESGFVRPLEAWDAEK